MTKFNDYLFNGYFNDKIYGKFSEIIGHFLLLFIKVMPDSQDV